MNIESAIGKIYHLKASLKAGHWPYTAVYDEFCDISFVFDVRNLPLTVSYCALIFTQTSEEKLAVTKVYLLGDIGRLIWPKPASHKFLICFRRSACNEHE